MRGRLNRLLMAPNSNLLASSSMVRGLQGWRKCGRDGWAEGELLRGTVTGLPFLKEENLARVLSAASDTPVS